MRAGLSLPFLIMCDVEGHVIREWGLLNTKERGNIAKPPVFVIDAGLGVLYAAVDTVARRVPAAEILSFLEARSESAPVRRKTYIPLPGDWSETLSE